jgi:ABC-type Fe3+/spermidine/putrescine transport system ATPase subunit
MFQRDTLLPWANVTSNISVGCELSGLPKDQHAARIASLIALVRLQGYENHYPAALSGGMRQRVSLARLLAFEPDIYLMDEPFGALDYQTKIIMGRELLRIWEARRRAIVFVTHDIEEAVALADRVIVMNVGVIEQIGTPEEIYNRPRSRFVADFVGSANLIKGRLTGANLFTTDGGVELRVTVPHRPSGKESELALRTAYIDLEPQPGDNHVPGTVRQRLFHGRRLPQGQYGGIRPTRGFQTVNRPLPHGGCRGLGKLVLHIRRAQRRVILVAHIHRPDIKGDGRA